MTSFFCYYAYEDGGVIYGWPIRREISFKAKNNMILNFFLFALIFLVHTANMYSGITVKTHVKTVKLNSSGLLTMYEYLPLYFKFTVIPMHLEQQ